MKLSELLTKGAKEMWTVTYEMRDRAAELEKELVISEESLRSLARRYHRDIYAPIDGINYQEPNAESVDEFLDRIREQAREEAEREETADNSNAADA